MDLSGKVAIVTGSGRGLGLAYAKALAGAGAAVVVNDIDEAVAQAAAAEITAAGGKAIAVAAAVGSSESAQALVDAAVEAFGRLDVLVANAGVLRDKVVWKMTDEDFDLVTQVHLKGTFTCARAAIVRMKEQGEGGRLILIGSPAGQYGNFGQTNYAAAKAGIVTFAKVWAMELSRDKITANAVVPVAATAMTATVPLPQALRRRHGRRRADARVRPPRARLRHPRGRRRAWSSTSPRTTPQGVNGQAIGIGGDRLSLYSHPDQIVKEYAAGGWSADAIAAAWPASSSPPASSPSASTLAHSPHGLRAVPADPATRHTKEFHHDASTWPTWSPSTCTSTSRSTTTGTRPCRSPSSTGRRSTSRPAAPRTPTIDEIAARYRERKIAAVIFTVDVEKSMGQPRIPNEGGRAGRRGATPTSSSRSPASTPRAGPRASRSSSASSPTTASGASSSTPACRTSPPTTSDAPTASTRSSPHHKLPAVFHTGQTGHRRRYAGVVAGVKLRYSDPMLLDDVAADFPDLPVILAHPSVPWQDQAISMATHKGNVYIDLSGWSPKYFPPAPRQGRQRRAAGQGAVRLGLPGHRHRPVAGRLRTPSTSSPRCGR
jgi:NAD(P)-dependent dehydrogenase (short-subunit alcohol dehydrogenase family)